MPKARTRRAVRAPLTRERIMDAAAEVIERVGLPAFSMRALGAELKVEAMSLYHHFPSKAHLCDALLDRLIAGIPPADPALPWEERVRAFSLSYRRAIVARPAFAHFVLTHRMNTPTGLRFLEQIVNLFRDAGFSTEESARAFRALGYYLMGALLDETSGYARGPTAAEPVPLDEQRRLAPGLISLAPWFQPAEWEGTFRFGLDLLLADFERLRRARTSDA